MKKTILSFMLLIFTMGAFAQNASMQKTAKAVFTLTTFNKDGSLKASSHGIFVSADGQAVSTSAQTNSMMSASSPLAEPLSPPPLPKTKQQEKPFSWAMAILKPASKPSTSKK